MRRGFAQYGQAPAFIGKSSPQSGHFLHFFILKINYLLFIKDFLFFADVVQHVEHPACDGMVVGSIQTVGSVSQVHIFGGK